MIQSWSNYLTAIQNPDGTMKFLTTASGTDKSDFIKNNWNCASDCTYNGQYVITVKLAGYYLVWDFNSGVTPSVSNVVYKNVGDTISVVYYGFIQYSLKNPV